MDFAPETPVSKRLRTESNEASTIECQSTLGSNDSLVTTSQLCSRFGSNGEGNRVHLKN